jgi:hypothetical protein
VGYTSWTLYDERGFLPHTEALSVVVSCVSCMGRGNGVASAKAQFFIILSDSFRLGVLTPHLVSCSFRIVERMDGSLRCPPPSLENRIDRIINHQTVYTFRHTMSYKSVDVISLIP